MLIRLTPRYLGVALCALSFIALVSGGYAQSADNEVFIEQLGATNQANVQQGDGGLALNNLAKVYQKGDGNIADISQSVFESTANHNTATLTQRGDNNEAVVGQGVGRSAATDNTATLNQHGHDNGTSVNQGLFGSTATSNTATLTQQGNNNDAEIFQGFAGGTAVDNTATLTQWGDGNVANMYQGAGSIGIRNVDGTFSQTFTNETSAIGSTATVSQHGDDHYAATIQAGTNDLIDIQQSGWGNYAVVAQGTAIP